MCLILSFVIFFNSRFQITFRLRNLSGVRLIRAMLRKKLWAYFFWNTFWLFFFSFFIQSKVRHGIKLKTTIQRSGAGEWLIIIFLQRLQYVRGQIQRELLGSGWQRIFSVWVATQSSYSSFCTIACQEFKESDKTFKPAHTNLKTSRERIPSATGSPIWKEDKTSLISKSLQ